MGIAVDYKGISFVPGVGDGEGAVVGGEVEDVDGGWWAVGLAGLAVVAGVLQSKETVGGGGDRRELSVNDDETSVEPCCHNGCRSAAPGRVQHDVPNPADFAQAQASRDRETAGAVLDATGGSKGPRLMQQKNLRPRQRAEGAQRPWYDGIAHSHPKCAWALPHRWLHTVSAGVAGLNSPRPYY